MWNRNRNRNRNQSKTMGSWDLEQEQDSMHVHSTSFFLYWTIAEDFCRSMSRLDCYLVPLIHARILVISWIVWIFEDPFFSIFVFIFSNSFGYGILCVWLLESRILWTFPIKFTQKVGCSTWHKLVKRHVFERFALFIAVTKQNAFMLILIPFKTELAKVLTTMLLSEEEYNEKTT